MKWTPRQGLEIKRKGEKRRRYNLGSANQEKGPERGLESSKEIGEFPCSGRPKEPTSGRGRQSRRFRYGLEIGCYSDKGLQGAEKG